MKIAILTTETTHHAYYVKSLQAIVDEITVFIEDKNISFPFDTKHDYEIDQVNYERELWFNGENLQLSNFSKTHTVKSINELSVSEHFSNEKYDAVFVFGTGKIQKSLIHLLPQHTYNLHGGDPERYRGLDTHLWSIYHNDFDALITTLHKLDADLDTGDIVCKSKVEIHKDMAIHQLRAMNTEVCVILTKVAIDRLKDSGKMIATKQRKTGRYYSAMPSCLKEVCMKKFQKYCNSLV